MDKLVLAMILSLAVFAGAYCTTAVEAAATDDKAAEAAQNIKDTLLEEGWLGPGGYFSPIKLPLYMVLFLTWVACASWANCDQERLKKQGRETFNLLYTLIYALGSTLVFFIPIFLAAFIITVLLCFVPVLMYVSARNKDLPPNEKVLTGEHLWYLYAIVMGKIGIKIEYERRLAYQGGPPVELEAAGTGVDEKTLVARLVLARNDPGYNLLRENIYEAIKSRATALMFNFSPVDTKIRHQVDGVWLDVVPIPRTPKPDGKDAYEELLEAAKKLIGGKPADRRSKQTGKFTAKYGSKGKKKKPVKYEIDFISQATNTGEAAMFSFHTQVVAFQNLDQLGMRAEIQPLVLNHLNSPKGVFVLSAPLTQGLRSTVAVMERVCDRFTRDVVNCENVHEATEAVENVILAQYDSAKGESPMTVLPDVLFKGVGVLFVRDISKPEVLALCCEEVAEERQFMLLQRAKDGVEALLKIISNGVPPQKVVPVLNAVIAQRLIRMLCPDCKETYQPDEKLLRQLGLSAGQAQKLYRKRTPLPTEYEERKRGVCPTCNGIGYYGRTGVFELLQVSDTIKALLLLPQPDPKAIRQQFNKEGQTNFIREGIHLLLKGVISVEEFGGLTK